MNTTQRRPPKGNGAKDRAGHAKHRTTEAQTGQLTLDQQPSAEVRENTHLTPQTGLQRAQENAEGDWWWLVAMRAIKWLAETPGTFEAFDLVLIGVPEPTSQNHWGALFSAAAKADVIEHVGFTVSRRPTRAGGLCRTWQGKR